MTAVDDQARLQPFLLPGERIAWTGRPEQGFVFERADLLGFALGLGVCALFAAVSFPIPGPDGFHVDDVFHLALLLIFGWALLGRFFYEAWLRHRLLYAVTNQRVLILRGRGGGRLRSHDLAWLPMLELDERGARGTINIDAEPDLSLWPSRVRATHSLEAFRFFRIERPRQVYDLICRASRDRRAELNRDLALQPGPLSFPPQRAGASQSSPSNRNCPVEQETCTLASALKSTSKEVRFSPNDRAAAPATDTNFIRPSHLSPR
jgi:hypothetical protein